jgi:succinoglycan biosynthesis transport protein ExoP
MNATTPPSLTPREVVRLLIDRRRLWVVPAVACGFLAAAYSLVMPRYWEASQALVVRQETAGSRGATPGKFADLFEMRTLQETILELAKSQQVVVATIKAVDQKLLGAATEPTAEDIETFRQRLKMLPPYGGEFGKTEVFYFCVKDRNRQRAIELVSELCRQLDGGLKQLRSDRAHGLSAELEEQLALASELHAQETQRLMEFESQVGADLGELRMLHSASSGQSDLRQEAVQLEADLRKYETQVRETQQLLSMLRAAEQDPQKLIATPNSLLASQPALRRLKDGLVDAQLATAKLGGTRSAAHPRVKAAVEEEQQIRRDLHRELITAISGAQVDLELGQERVATTQTRLADLHDRLGSLATKRAEYSNRVAAVDNSRITLDRARQNLSTAKAAAAAAHSGSLVTRIDRAETGPYPAGPGRTVITAAGGVGGLMLGLGMVLLTVGIRTESEERQRRMEAPQPVMAATASTKTPWRGAREPEPTPWDLERLSGKGGRGFDSTELAELCRAEEVPSCSAIPAQQEIRRPENGSFRTASETPIKPQPIAAPIAPATDQLVQAQEAIVAKKPSLPVTPGTLPTTGSVLPPLSITPSLGGLSLQEALQAARQAQL